MAPMAGRPEVSEGFIAAKLGARYPTAERPPLSPKRLSPAGPACLFNGGRRSAIWTKESPPRCGVRRRPGLVPHLW